MPSASSTSRTVPSPRETLLDRRGRLRRRLARLVDRQVQLERRADPFLAVDEDVPAALLDDAVDGREAQAIRARHVLGREERLEDLSPGRQPGSRCRCRSRPAGRTGPAAPRHASSSTARRGSARSSRWSGGRRAGIASRALITRFRMRRLDLCLVGAHGRHRRTRDLEVDVFPDQPRNERRHPVHGLVELQRARGAAPGAGRTRGAAA